MWTAILLTCCNYDVQIVGMGEKWSGFWQKFRGYWNAIDDSDIIDDDVIVLIDAYDVLLFPQAKRIGEVSCV